MLISLIRQIMELQVKMLLLTVVASVNSMVIGNETSSDHYPATTNASRAEIEVVEQRHGTLLGWIPPIYYINQCPSCTLKLSGGALRLAPWHSGYPPHDSSTRITITYKPNLPRNFVITFRTMDLYGRTSGVCVKSRLDLYDGYGTLDRLSGPSGLCGVSVRKEQYVTTSSAVTILYKTERLHSHTYQYFEAVITPFHIGTCSSDEMRCRNGRCISDELLCDGYNNCGDNSDEMDCGNIILSIGAIVGIVVGCVIVVGIITAIIICRCCCYALDYTRF